MKNCLGIINLSEVEINIQQLTKIRPIASLPFAGRYRIIDFMLSNFVNSGINNVAIFTQNKFKSLVDHIGSGKAWDLDRKITGISIFNPTINYNRIVHKRGDLEYFYENIDYIKHASQDYIVISRSYMICNIDLKEAYRFHKNSNTDITMIYKNTENKKEYLNLDTLNIDSEGKLVSIGKNTLKNDKVNLSMEMYVMKKDLLVKIIEESIQAGGVNYLKQAVFNYMSNLTLSAFEYDGYLACINSSKSFYDANMDMLKPKIYNQLFIDNQTIFTKVKDEPSTIYREGSKVNNSLVANGCDIQGEVNNSVLFRNVKVDKGTVINNSIIMEKNIIGENCSLNYIISDKYVGISDNNILAGSCKVPYIIEKRIKL